MFDVSRLIYARDYTKINEVYRDHNIPADLGLVIGAITESQKLIDHALESEQKGGQINMCNALEELRQGEVLSNFTLSNVSFVFSFKPFRLKWNFT